MTILAQTNQISDDVKYYFCLLLQIFANIYLVLELLSTQYKKKKNVLRDIPCAKKHFNVWKVIYN